jgi:prevent-host-death family protein
MDHMRTTPLVKAKAHLSELVDAAEHRGQRILILRHGKPAAAIVPVEVAQAPPKTVRRRRLSRERFAALLDTLARSDNATLTLEESLGRARLDAGES